MNSKGFSLVEVLLAVSVFGLIITGLIGGLIYGQQSTALAGARSRAAMLADEGLEAVRNIRDENFSNLTDGTFGLTTTSNQWNLSGSSDVTDIFTRQVVVSAIDTNRKSVTVNVSWQQNPQRNGVVSVITYLTNWKTVGGGGPPATCNDYCISLGTYSQGTCRKGNPQCIANGETMENGGNSLCLQAEGGTCCCAP